MLQARSLCFRLFSTKRLGNKAHSFPSRESEIGNFRKQNLKTEREMWLWWYAYWVKIKSFQAQIKSFPHNKTRNDPWSPSLKRRWEGNGSPDQGKVQYSCDLADSSFPSSPKQMLKYSLCHLYQHPEVTRYFGNTFKANNNLPTYK